MADAYYTRNGHTSTVKVYKDQGYVEKWVKGGDLRPCLQMEVDALKRIAAVDPKHFSELLEVHKDHIRMTYCGEVPTRTTVPENFEEQIVEIINVLKEADVINRDIRPGNLLIHNCIIKVIDFGWATSLKKPVPRPAFAPGLGGDYRKAKDTFDDVWSLKKSITDIRNGTWPRKKK